MFVLFGVGLLRKRRFWCVDCKKVSGPGRAAAARSLPCPCPFRFWDVVELLSAMESFHFFLNTDGNLIHAGIDSWGHRSKGGRFLFLCWCGWSEEIESTPFCRSGADRVQFKSSFQRCTSHDEVKNLFLSSLSLSKQYSHRRFPLIPPHRHPDPTTYLSLGFSRKEDE